jgi:hypothetical protein
MNEVPMQPFILRFGCLFDLNPLHELKSPGQSRNRCSQEFVGGQHFETTDQNRATTIRSSRRTIAWNG